MVDAGLMRRRWKVIPCPVDGDLTGWEGDGAGVASRVGHGAGARVGPAPFPLVGDIITRALFQGQMLQHKTTEKGTTKKQILNFDFIRNNKDYKFIRIKKQRKYSFKSLQKKMDYIGIKEIFGNFDFLDFERHLHGRHLEGTFLLLFWSCRR